MSNYFLAFDTETGDLNPESGDLLTAYFAILNENFNIVEELDLQLKPNGGRIPVAAAGALKVNGINLKEHVEDPNTLTYADGAAVLTTMINKYLKKYRGKSNIIPMGYNILGFDIAWIQHHLLPKKDWNNLMHYKSTDVMCEVDFLKVCGWLPSTIGSLGTVVEHLQLPVLNAHEAKSDVLMTISVHKKLLEIMKSKENGGSTTQDLISMLESE